MNQNPYESPQHGGNKKPPAWLAILVAVLALPASVIAFLVTCTAAAAATEPSLLPIGIGIVAALLVAGGMLWIAVAGFRRK
jgi:hypothetical protein